MRWLPLIKRRRASTSFIKQGRAIACGLKTVVIIDGADSVEQIICVNVTRYIATAEPAVAVRPGRTLRLPRLLNGKPVRLIKSRAWTYTKSPNYSRGYLA
jgi:hypothetical protein